MGARRALQEGLPRLRAELGEEALQLGLRPLAVLHADETLP